MSEGQKPRDIPEEDLLRANVYALIARLMVRSPDAEVLASVAALKGDESDFGQAVRALARAAQATSPASVQDEYFRLFVGIGGSELYPYASYYLTGFLNEKPLANLRDDMRRLGIERAEGVKVSEDHIASLCEIMAGLITGAFGGGTGLAEQRAFYEAHLAPWAARFFEDLEKAEGASFYMPVGNIGRLFLEVEDQAFDMAA